MMAFAPDSDMQHRMNIGAFLIRIVLFFFGGGCYAIITRNPQDSIGNYQGPYFIRVIWHL